MRLIDAVSLNVRLSALDRYARSNKEVELLSKVFRVLNTQPTVAVEQNAVNVSEWLEDSDPGQEYGTTLACFKCQHSIHKPFVWNPYNSGYKYCPYCGSKMEVSLDD